MTLQFDHFELQPIHNGDAWKICDFMVANQDRLKRFLPKTLEQNLTPSLSQLFVEKKVKQFKNKEEFLFTLKHTETRKLAGIVYVKNLDWTLKKGEFAYALDYNFKGKGMMSKTIGKLSAYAFETLALERLQIIAHKDNIPSILVAENNGFKWKKTLKNEFTPPNGQALDMELYELDNNER